MEPYTSPKNVNKMKNETDKQKSTEKTQSTSPQKKAHIPLAERPYLKELNGTWDCSQAGKCFAMPYRRDSNPPKA